MRHLRQVLIMGTVKSGAVRAVLHRKFDSAMVELMRLVLFSIFSIFLISCGQRYEVASLPEQPLLDRLTELQNLKDGSGKEMDLYRELGHEIRESKTTSEKLLLSLVAALKNDGRFYFGELFETLRENFIDSGVKPAEFESTLRRLAFPSAISPLDRLAVCNAVCDIRSRWPEWYRRENSRINKRMPNEPLAFHLEYRSAAGVIAGSFLQQSAKACVPSAEAESNTLTLINRLVDSMTEEEKKEREYQEAMRKLLEGLDDADREVIKKVYEETYSGTSKAQTGSYMPLTTHSHYGLFFEIAFLETLRHAPNLPQENLKSLDTFLAGASTQLRSRFGGYLANPKDGTRDATASGSLWNTFSLGLAYLLNHEKLKDGGTVFRKVIDPTDPFRFTYRVPREENGEDYDSVRGSAARAPLVYYSLMRHADSEAARKKYRTLLIAALENYGTYLPSLMLHAYRAGTHSGEDAMLPGYAYGANPFVLSMVSSLSKSLETTLEEKQRLAAVGSQAARDILAARRPNGLYPAMPEESGIRDSDVFTNAISGLSLVPMIDLCTGDSGAISRNERGILGYQWDEEDQIHQ